jgi:hypothetical protein
MNKNSADILQQYSAIISAQSLFHNCDFELWKSITSTGFHQVVLQSFRIKTAAPKDKQGRRGGFFKKESA